MSAEIRNRQCLLTLSGRESDIEQRPLIPYEMGNLSPGRVKDKREGDETGTDAFHRVPPRPKLFRQQRDLIWDDVEVVPTCSGEIAIDRTLACNSADVSEPGFTHKIMLHEMNHLGQPIGFSVVDWKPPPAPSKQNLTGRLCHLERLNPKNHGTTLYAANALDVEGRNWTYLPYGPFETLAGYLSWMEQYCGSDDPLFYAIIDQKTSNPVGVAAYLRMNSASGSIEVGHLNFSPLLQRTPGATEAMYLMMEYAFGSGFRRFEWKCDALNEPSRRAAQRLGLSFEGIFRHASVVKGRNRDTAWYAAVDADWPRLKEAILKWLEPSNFDQIGKQRTPLSVLTKPILKQVDSAARSIR